MTISDTSSNGDRHTRIGLMSKIFGLILLVWLLIPTSVAAQMIPLGKPTFCLPVAQMWTAYAGDENEVLLFSAIHVNSENPVTTYWNPVTDVVSVIEYTDMILEDQFGRTKEQQVGCIVAMGKVTTMIDFDSISAKEVERKKQGPR